MSFISYDAVQRAMNSPDALYSAGAAFLTAGTPATAAADSSRAAIRSRRVSWMIMYSSGGSSSRLTDDITSRSSGSASANRPSCSNSHVCCVDEGYGVIDEVGGIVEAFFDERAAYLQ